MVPNINRAYSAKYTAYGTKYPAYGAKHMVPNIDIAYGAKYAAYGAKYTAYGVKYRVPNIHTAYGAKYTAYGAKYTAYGAEYIVPNIHTAYAPNIDGTMGDRIKTRKHLRHGAQCVIQNPTNRNPAQSLQCCNAAFGHRLYDSLRKYLRDVESVKTEKFKFEPNKFLEFIPDEPPKMPNYVIAAGAIASSTS